ncbi:O-antigen ligase family protein [Flavobacterium sp.]|uniref:O-antigen ligase family protein n=1 Tax=Flavobacterium sp. TaxID=239 RepID=UPI00286C5A0C|nr:O-antigen ligase family protein [Flavobacterium sp.]
MLENKVYSNFVTFSLFLNSAVLIIPNKFKAYPILIFFICSLVYYLKSERKNTYSFQKIILIGALPLIYLASWLYSFESNDAFFKLSTMASLLGYPIVFGLLESSYFSIQKKQIETIFKVFVFSTTLFCIVSFIYFWRQEFSFYETTIHYFNLINIRLSIFSIHPIYLAIYLGISILMLVYLTQSNPKLFFKMAYLFWGLFLAVVLVLLMRKGPIIYLLMSLCFLLAHYLKIKKAIIVLILVLAGVVFSVKFIPKYQNENRFNELTDNALNENPESSIAIRYRVYQCVMEKITEKPFLGYGVGNVKRNLDPCYVSKNLDITQKNYNSHNQFFSVVLTAGLIGFCIYLFSIYSIFRILNQKKSILGIAIFVFFVLNFLTENVMERENGALIYSFLISFFLYQSDESYKSV